MPKAAHIEASFRAITASSAKSDNGALVSVLLFSGIGLLVSLVAVIAGVQGVWF